MTWIETKDRLPTEADADRDGEILVFDALDERWMFLELDSFVADLYPAWIPLGPYQPPAPETTLTAQKTGMTNWIETADRLPTEEDATDGFIWVRTQSNASLWYHWSQVSTSLHRAWIPIPEYQPPAPETTLTELDLTGIACRLKHFFPQCSWCVECSVWRHIGTPNADLRYKVSSIPGVHGSEIDMFAFATFDELRDWAEARSGVQI